MKFNEEEISLCKQVAERHKKPMENFDSVVGTHLSGEEFIGYFHEELTKEKLMKARLDEVMVGFCETAKTTKPMILLWTISDCLEFLREQEYTFERAYQLAGIFHVIFISNSRKGIKESSGDTLLIACLKAVLAVLEEE